MGWSEQVELPMYGQENIVAPHLQSLAARGTVFDRAYCNQPVCSPSRNSFMSSRRPDKTKVWNFKNTFREVGPRWTTLNGCMLETTTQILCVAVHPDPNQPSHFLTHDYLTLGTGKLYHEDLPPNGDGNLSWTDSAVQFSCVDSSAGGDGTYCDPKMASCETPGPAYAPHPRWCVVPSPDGSSHGDGYFADVNTTRDALMKFQAIRAAGPNRSFFLGVGLRKPHLDWRVPQSYLDKYPSESVGLAAHPVAPAGMPQIAYHDTARSIGEHKTWAAWGYRDPWTPMKNVTARDMRRHYYAAVTFMDDRVGEMLDGLEQAGKQDSTIVLFHADHGWALGESGMWRKFQLTELGTRVPLIVSVPWLPQSHGKRSSVITELVDVMPSLSDLAGLPPPAIHAGEAPLDGVSFASVLESGVSTSPITSNAEGKGWALSVYPRCPTDPIGHGLWYNNWCIEVDREAILYMGYSLRVHGWRYTAWQPWNGTSLSAVAWPEHKPRNGTAVTENKDAAAWAGEASLFFEELFAYTEEPGSELDLDGLDVLEVSGHPENAATTARLYAQIRAYVLDAEAQP